MAYKFQTGQAILSGALLQEGNVEIESGFSFKMGSTTLSEAEVGVLDSAVAGTAAASKAVVLDGSRDITNINDMTLTGDVILPQSSNLFLAGDGSSAKIVSTGGNAVSIFGAKAVFNGSSIEPDSDAGTDLGSSTKEFKDLYLDGVAYIDDLRADTANIDGGSIDATVIGGSTQAAGSFTTLSGSSTLQVGGTVRLDGVADTALDVAADSFYYLDAGDSLVKKDSMADYATAIAGTGIKAASGVLALDVNELSQAAVADGDFIVIQDATDDSTKKEAVADLASLFAGAGLAAASSVIGIANATNGGIGVHADNISVDLNDLAAAAVDVANDSIAIVDANDSGVSKKESVADLMTAVAGTGLKAASGVLALDANELSQAAVASGDFFVFEDATDNSTKKESVDDLATLFAGTGLAAASAVLSLDLNELVAEQIASGDFLAFVDSTDNGTHKETVDDLATLFAGDGLAAASAVLSVQVSGAVKIASDKVGLSGSIAGNGLAYKGGRDSISALEVDLSEFSAGAIASGDSFAFIDANDSDSMKKETVDDLATLFAGTGLAAASAVLSLDLNELSAGAVSVANDSIAIIDADDNGSKKESIADLVDAMAGAGLSAANGVLSVQASSATAIANGGTLAEGYNFFADLDGVGNSASVALPGSPSVGDVVTLKAKNLENDAIITITTPGSFKIDDEDTIDLDSPYAAVTLVYVATNDWRIV